MCDVSLCFFVTFPYGVLDQVWYWIVLIPDRCILPYFHCINIDENEITLHRWIHKKLSGVGSLIVILVLNILHRQLSEPPSQKGLHVKKDEFGTIEHVYIFDLHKK